ARQKSCPWNGWTCAGSVEGGHLTVRKWVCSWRHGDFGALIFGGHACSGHSVTARENGCSCDERTGKFTALGGKLKVLRWFRKGWGPCDHGTCAAAASQGHVDGVSWAKEKCCPWVSTSLHAAFEGHLPALQWTRRERTYSLAARGGYLDVLRMARIRDYPWDDSTCSSTLAGGHLACLQWARQNSCEWGKQTCCSATSTVQLEVIRWARENGCQWREDTCLFATSARFTVVLRWVRANGSAWD
ncbi:unnamed protein product, partial [Hapterophycus canaliculatus]